MTRLLEENRTQLFNPHFYAIYIVLSPDVAEDLTELTEVPLKGEAGPIA